MKLNGKEVDYDQIQKVTIGDLEDLEERGIRLNQISKGDFSVKMAIDFIELFAHKVNDGISREDVRQLDMNELTEHSNKIAERINAGQEYVGSPSS